MTKKLCIVCGKPIAKRVTDYTFSLPRAAVPARPGPFGHPRGIEARPAGSRDVSPHGGMVTLYLDDLPKTRDDVQRLVNGEILSTRRDGLRIVGAGVWDGESYRSQYFHADRCAAAQGVASAQHGHRYTWSKE
jgi:hypothetical protein